MKLLNLKFTSTIASALFALTAMNAQAATITWGTAQTITGASDVVTDYTLLHAYSLGGVGSTVNSVVFSNGNSGTTFPAAGTDEGNVTFTAKSGSTLVGNATAYIDSAASQTTGNSDYDTILQSAFLSSPGTELTMTINNLVDGKDYFLQIWSMDGRDLGMGRETSFTAGNSVTLDQNVNDSIGTSANGLGQFVTGTFTAVGTTQVIDIQGVNGSSNSAVINAYQIAVIPEPATISLLALGLGTLVLSRLTRRRR